MKNEKTYKEANKESNAIIIIWFIISLPLIIPIIIKSYQTFFNPEIIKLIDILCIIIYVAVLIISFIFITFKEIMSVLYSIKNEIKVNNEK